MSSNPSESLVQQLSAFSACEISDALIKLGSPNGGHIPDIHLVSSSASSQTICGPAYTVQMAFTSDTSAPKLSSHFIDTAPAGTVIVINAPPTAKNAVWGGLMSAGAQTRKTIGVVISGRCRDTRELNSLGYPVFSRGRSTLGQSPFTRPSAVDISLEIHTEGAEDNFPPVTVRPGDYIVADVDGVVCIPQEDIQRVVDTARKGKEIDERCMEDIKAGKSVRATFKTHRG
ncbi:RraA-like protein [Thelephora terrestris]|uniref:RraA-like protein n=1 Tax=Thelephora terrestris TaxID=56493 RepID=A0A9P6HSD1_9AGAM|nr:RraA-like protein [Thelephora terrestris]